MSLFTTLREPLRHTAVPETERPQTRIDKVDLDTLYHKMLCLQRRRATLTESQARHLDLAARLLARRPLSRQDVFDAAYEVRYAGLGVPEIAP